jgi:predicted enzyme related to lactoylglutathione lyase
MRQVLAKVAVVVEDYDEAIAFYVDKLGFGCTEDTDLGGGKRWVTVRPAGAAGPELLLARAVNDRQRSRVGDQTGGRVFLFFETDDLARDVERYRRRGVRVAREPELQPWGTVAVIEDLYGNRIDLIEPRERDASQAD